MPKSSAVHNVSLGPALQFLEQLWALNHALEKLSGNMLTKLGVTAQQRLVIRCLGQIPGMPAGQLASLLHLDPGTISATLRRLQAKGLIQRKKDPDDQRRVVLILSRKGRELDKAAPGTVENAVESLLREANSKDLAATARVLERLTELLHAEIVE
ncbi:MAG TPA: MarR family transcriptional regulator [Polyangiaceae bacterium]|jgi:DNA-binding MarR family transcriptional regulator|nr:MarR family transcriptional regulator [Polyangiaceae bacterium]